MTGFGAAEGLVGSTRVSVELRSVNHRFFSPSIKLPGDFARWEADVREALRRRIARGHVTLYARAERDAIPGAVVDQDRFASYVELLRALRDRYGLAGDVDVATVLRMPDVVVAPSSEGEGDGSAAELVSIVEAAAQGLGASRAEEGARLAAVLAERLAVVERALATIAARAPQRLVEQRDRLRASVRELTDGVAIDEQRVAQEIAVLADRLDVNEELDRFASHIAAFRGTLNAPGDEPVGKRLGFLLQEMLREANTTGSKAADATIMGEVIRIKEELERLREQVENLE
jgi:uncharacterized protein (TIGR00255 family)